MQQASWTAEPYLKTVNPTAKPAFTVLIIGKGLAAKGII